eukprot:10638276-Heterocapsa_arctica.AAC.1
MTDSSASLGWSRSILKSPQKQDLPAKVAIPATMARSVGRRACGGRYMLMNRSAGRVPLCTTHCNP